MSTPEILLHLGTKEPWRLPFDGDRFRSFHAGPATVSRIAHAIKGQLESPVDFPPFSAMCVPGDRVVVVLDRQLPSAGLVLSEVLHVLEATDADLSQVVVLQPAHWQRAGLVDPRMALPERFRATVQWKVHDPTDPKGIAYLASSTNGERIYLARELVEADLILPIFTAGFDPVVGLRSPGGLMYPGLSNVEAFAKTRGEGHRELRPENDRPLRQLADEICWLLGVQFAISIVPSRIADQAGAVIGGQFEAVQRQSRQFLNHAWSLQLDRRAEMVVVSVGEPEATVGWDEIGAALALAESLVERDGRIVLLSSLAAEPGPGLQYLKSSRSPTAALQHLRREQPPDLISSLQVGSAASWARISVISRLDSTLVDDLQMSPLDSLAEAERLIGQADDVVLIDGANRMWGEIVSE